MIVCRFLPPFNPEPMQVITTHLNADFDCLASMLAAKKLYPEARLVFPGSHEKNVRDFLKYSDISFSFDRLRNFPIEEIDLLIVVDTRKRDRIGELQRVLDRPDAKIHIYDHHPFVESDIKAEKVVVEERGATVTIMVEILREKGIDILPDEATIMALGLYEDTASLTTTTTTVHDFRAAEFLLSKGANLSTVSDFISRELSTGQVWLLNELLRSIETHKIKGVEVNIATASTDSYINDLALLTHKVKDIQNLNLLFSIVRMEERVYLVARSRIEAVDVAEVAMEFGGGGHPTASSATVRDLTLFQAKDKLLKVLQEKIHSVDEIREIMSTPAKAISEDEPISEARKLMVMFGLNALPVTNENGKPVGLITRQVMGKAVHHQMEKEKVREVMSGDIATVFPDTPFQELSGILLEKKQAIAPVIQRDTGLLVGVASRSDLLNKLYGESLKKPGTSSKGQEIRYAHSKSVKGLMRERLAQRIFHLFETAGNVCDEMGFNVYVVGGFVRDLLLRIENLDVDLVVEGNGIQFARRLAETFEGRVHSHKRFQTAVVTLPDGFKVDVATARLESYEHPAALPMVEQGSIRNDLYRRDFTINALAIKLNGKKAYRLIDFFGGQKDLREKAVRVLQNLSFVEDPTRAFRAIRFEQRFNFEIGKHTLALLNNAVRKKHFDRLSGGRVLNELILMFREKEPHRMIKRMASLGLLEFIHPAIKLNEPDMAFLKRINEAVVWYTLLYTGKPAKEWLVYLMGLFRNLEPSQKVEACEKLGLLDRNMKIIVEGKEWISRAGKLLVSKRNLTPTDIYEALTPLQPELLLYMMASLEKEEAKKQLSYYVTQLRDVKAELSGKDLLKLGLTPGPIFTEVLDAVRNAKLEGILLSREDEINFVKEKFAGKD